ncbi:hypothetical protein ABIA39_008635 [Nocardia sp. GAS34]|uniref:hypothetical protein n=1 Tax=unclassified Nocardia TaxID=2637762 RepID=UPI003D25542D
MLESEAPEWAVPGMLLLWIDSLFAVTRPPTPAFVPATAPGVNDKQMWALWMIPARANNDPDMAQQVFQEAVSSDFDQLIESS